MVHFLGIFGPGRLVRQQGQEAPLKANFFGGLADAAQGAVPMSRAELDACFLAGKAPEPAPARDDPERDGMPER
jgi:hypothetical protein